MPRAAIGRVGCVAAAVTAIVLTAEGQCEMAQLVPADGVAAGFGFSLAADGDTLVGGAPFNDEAATDSGAAYVFEHIGGFWVETAKLVASNGAINDHFGDAVEIEGDTIVVGAQDSDVQGGGSGAAYVFGKQGSAWIEVQRLTKLDALAAAAFGSALSLSGTRLLVGAEDDDQAGTDRGAAHVFDLVGATWVESAKLLPTGGGGQQHFGGAVDLDGTRAVVGAKDNSPPPFSADSGSVYVFDLQGSVWVMTQELIPSDIADDMDFGASVVVEGDRIWVGATHISASPGGAIYEFTLIGSTWIETDKIIASAASTGDCLGYDTVKSGDLLLSGAYLTDDVPLNSGAAYVFHDVGSSWNEVSRVVASDAAALDWFGYAVAASSDHLLVATYNHAISATQFGAVYAFSKPLIPAPTDTLTAPSDCISLATGGSQNYTLSPGPSYAGQIYALAGSLSGTSPGLPFGSVTVPLNLDPYFLFTLKNPAASPLVSSVGIVDVSGTNTASFVLPPGADPTLAGMTAHHAFAVIDPVTGAVKLASNALAVYLTP